jgi:hypothetical protein
LHLSEATKLARCDEIDGYGDPFVDEIDEVDLRQVGGLITVQFENEFKFVLCN